MANNASRGRESGGEESGVFRIDKRDIAKHRIKSVNEFTVLLFANTYISMSYAYKVNLVITDIMIVIFKQHTYF